MLFACLLPPLLPGSSHAQGNSDEIIEEIVVTGYHIRRAGPDGPAPVVVFDRDALDTAGFNTLGEFAQLLPYNLQTFSDAGRIIGTTAGASNFNLRGIGNDSTLTLINGRRIAPYGNGEFGTELFVDINAIPMTAIERIEILKDGASAIYGSDAVAGVVNIILQREREGIKVEAGYLTASRGDLSELTASLTGGWNWRTGSILAGLTWFDRSPLYDRERQSLADIDLTANGGRNFRSGFSSPPSVFLLESGGRAFDPECPEDGLINNRLTTPSGGSCRFNFSQFTTHIFASERLGAAVLLEQDVGDRSSAYGELIWSDNRTRTVLAPTPVDHFVPSSHPGNPFAEDVLAFHRVLETGDRQANIQSETLRAVAGLKGDVAGFDFDLGLTFSENEIETAGRNYILVNAMQDALLGFGGPNGDQFYNPFGLSPNNDPAVLDSVRTNTLDGARTKEISADITFTSDVASLQHGAVGLALGAQLRSMDLDEFLDPLSLAGEVAGGRVGTEIHADRNVWAVFAELGVPVLESVELQLAVRHDRYNDFGGTTNPKIALQWRPVEAIRMHGSFGTSYRAPAFRELFDPLFRFTVFVTDKQRCEATGDPVDCFDQLVDMESAGNTELKPEEGRSWLFGVDWEPAAVDGLTLGADFWRFEHDERVVLPEGEFLFDICPECVIRAPQTPSEEAAGIPGELLLLRSTYINSDQLVTQGIDMDAMFLWDAAGSTWQIVWSHTYLDEYRFPNSLTLGEGAEFAGKVFLEPLPKHRGNVTFSWTKGIHHVRATGHYVSEYQSNNNLFVDQVETDTPFYVRVWFSLDVQYEVTLEKLRDAVIRIGCQNCGDRQPSPFNNFETRDTGLHDKRGRIYYLRWTQPF